MKVTDTFDCVPRSTRQVLALLCCLRLHGGRVNASRYAYSIVFGFLLCSLVVPSNASPASVVRYKGAFSSASGALLYTSLLERTWHDLDTRHFGVIE